MADPTSRPVFAAIDVGTNAARLELARPGATGELETVLKERDAIRPGEGVFAQGTMSPGAADRLVSTLRRYAAVCRRHKAQVRAVATSALREARNQREVLQRVREEAGLELEVVSGEEEARLICLGVLHRTPPRTRSLLVDLGGGSTEVVLATGERPDAMWSLPLGAVRLTQLFDTSGEVSPSRLRSLRDFAEARLLETLPAALASPPFTAIGSSGTIRALVDFAARDGSRVVSREELASAAHLLARMTPQRRREHFDTRRADIIVAGAVLLERLLHHLGVEGITAVKRGLRDGLLVDLWSRQDGAAGGEATPLANGRVFPREARAAGFN
jgi:exopolyphosphatase / guanosine-5'-triphosphate,3'-diphosphate pyrophosphatase